jgi:predicted patatin/cPLA2 family phospholipase
MKYLEPFVHALMEGLSTSNLPKKLDIVLEGGALNGAYEAGVLCYVKEMEKRKMLTVEKISGVSCGALIGMLYLTSQLESLEEFYGQLSSSLLESGNFSNLEKVIEKGVENVNEATLAKLNDRLFITYVNLTDHSRCVVSQFKTKEELAECLKKSSYLPYFIDGKSSTNDLCIDGGTPFLFPFDNEKRRNPSYKTLYVKLTSFRLLKEALSVKAEMNVATRAVDGIQKTHNLLKHHEKNDLVSFVEDWKTSDYLISASTRLIWYVLSYFIQIMIEILHRLPDEVKHSRVVTRASQLFKELWKDYGHRILN